MTSHNWGIGFDQPGTPSQLRKIQLPRPTAGAGEVVVAVRAVAVNPTDIALRLGVHGLGLPTSGPPYFPGMDFSGTVIEHGSDCVDAPAVGTDVIGVVSPHQPSGGSYQQLIAVPKTQVTSAPSSLKLESACAFAMNAMTALLAIEALAEGVQTVAISGAGGVLGQALTIFSHSAGLQVIAQASQSEHDRLLVAGATWAIDRHVPFEAEVRRIHPGGVDAVFDAAVLNELAANAVSDGGTHVTFRGWQGPIDRNVHLHAIRVYDHLQRHDLLERARDAVDTGLLPVRVADVFAAEDAAAAHEKQQAGRLPGRIIIDFGR